MIFPPSKWVVNIVLSTLNDVFVHLGDAPPPSAPSVAAPLSVPVGVPPGLEYLTQVILLSFIYNDSLASMNSLNNRAWSL